MKNFDELYEMYINGDEQLYIELCDVDIVDIIHDCNKNICLYYDFREWLESVREYFEIIS